MELTGEDEEWKTILAWKECGMLEIKYLESAIMMSPSSLRIIKKNRRSIRIDWLANNQWGSDNWSFCRGCRETHEVWKVRKCTSFLPSAFPGGKSSWAVLKDLCLAIYLTAKKWESFFFCSKTDRSCIIPLAMKRADNITVDPQVCYDWRKSSKRCVRSRLLVPS